MPAQDTAAEPIADATREPWIDGLPVTREATDGASS